MSNKKALRASLSQVSLSLGLLTLTVDLVPAQRSKKSRETARPTVSNICPKCETPTKLAQKFHCSEHVEHGPYALTDAHKAVDIDGTLVRTSSDAVESAKAPEVNSRLIPLSVYRSDDLARHSLPSGNIYRVRLKKPSPITIENFTVIRELVSKRDDIAFLGELVLKGVVKPYRLIVWQGDLVLTELIRPNEFHAPEEIDAPACEPAYLEMAERLTDALLEEFDPDAWADRAEARLAQLRDLLATGTDEAATSEDVEAADAAQDLLALLEQSVAKAA